jgi:hypothetical protein
MVYSLVVGGAGPRPGVRRFHVAYMGGGRLGRTHDLEEALGLLEDRLPRYVALRARRRVFVHAGVVGWQGRAILIPGRSMSGKSWLVRALVRAGAEYYSDEFAVLDARGRVDPYPLPLGIRGSEAGNASAAEGLTGRTGRRPLPVGLVVSTRFRPGGRWRPRALTPGRAVLELLSHTIPARSAPERAVETLSRVVAQARVLRGARGEADEAASRILEVERGVGPEAVPACATLPAGRPSLFGD